MPISLEYIEGETLSVMGHRLVGCKTRLKPLYTEVALFDAMEGCGKQEKLAGDFESCRAILDYQLQHKLDELTVFVIAEIVQADKMNFYMSDYKRFISL